MKSLVLVMILTTISYSRVESQSHVVTEIPDRPSCTACSLSAGRVVVLDLPRDSTDQFPIRVTMDSRRRYWVFRRQNLPLLYDENGKLIQELGGKGLGLGRFVSPYDAIFVDGDSTLILDGIAQRITLLDVSLSPVRYIAMPFPLSSPVVVSWPGSIFANARVPTPEGAGWPLHEVSLKGDYAAMLRPFGPGDGTLRPEAAFEMRYLLGRARGNGFWSVASFSYDIAQWSVTGSLQQMFVRRPPWFRRDSAAMQYDWRTDPPPSSAVSISEDAEGLLWVFVRIPSPRWKEAYASVPRDVSEAPSRSIRTHRLYTTILEVIDPRAGRVLVRHSLDEYVISGLSGRQVAVYGENVAGRPSILIRMLSLVGRGGTR